ncbi:GGDEF domain-containing protein [Rhizobium lusitanum]|uniref:GGDEF domain-containing protein n=1 Tax=Rhizobium lusitanum TaxID=293958 RepID=UPI001FEE9E16|nr:GGDEF domain-containing protein [Rhizobium lusitanum]
MMEAGTVFTTVSLMMLANGGVLAVVSRDLPSTLRPAATYWQLGTLLIAVGCAFFAFGETLPRPIMLLAANGLIVFGLTAYHAAVQQFDGIHPRAWQLIPAILASACVFWFSAVNPDFRVRIAVVSTIWIWLMSACLWTLLASSHGDSSLSRKILIGNFALVLAYTLGRGVAYLAMDLSSDFAVETGANWLNLLSPIFMTLLPVVGTTAFLLMCSDKLRRQFEIAASTDYLTGLPNRRVLATHGINKFVSAQKHGADFAVAILDIDNFKAINDAYGHDVGDEVLVEVAGRLRERIGTFGMVARTGGEEFTVLLSGLDHIMAADAIERMRFAVEQAQVGDGMSRIPVTVSAGVAVYSSEDGAFEDMLRRADMALYSAKARGRNCVEVALQTANPALTRGVNCVQ